LCVQRMFKGDIKEIPHILNTLYHDFTKENNLIPVGPYHEIYLDKNRNFNPRQTKMIIRQGVKRE
ncbi:MAG: hypothetical protein EOM67_14625, partial [Spirochaetia bacterium]|nr:hypothetical protein [Spirochaetia bacterium]